MLIGPQSRSFVMVVAPIFGQALEDDGANNNADDAVPSAGRIRIISHVKVLLSFRNCVNLQ